MGVIQRGRVFGFDRTCVPCQLAKRMRLNMSGTKFSTRDASFDSFLEKTLRKSQELSKGLKSRPGVSIQEQLQEAQEQIHALSSKLMSETLDKEASQMQVEELKRRLSSGTAAKKQLYDSHTKLQARYSAAQDQACSVNDQLQEEVSALRTTLKSKDLEMRQRSSEAGLLQQSLEDHGKRQQKHESKMREAERQVSALRAELAEANGNCKKANDKLETMEEGKAAMISRINNLQRQTKELEAQLEDAQKEAAALKSRSKQEMVVTDHTKTYRDRDMLAARFAVQEAVRDMELAKADRDDVAEQLSVKAQAYRRLEKRKDAREQELTMLRRDHSARLAVVAELQATNRTAHQKVEGLERQVQQLQNELERQHFHREDLSQRARDSVQGKADLQLRHQQLEYTHKIQDLELRLERLAGAESTLHPHNYMPRSEHVRLLEARLATQAAESEAELHRRLNESRKEVQFKVEAEVEESTKAEVRHLKARIVDADQEVCKLQDRMQEVLAKSEVLATDLAHAKDESRRAHLAAESANGQQKEAARQLQRSQDAAAEARSEAQEVGMQLKLEKERAHIAEQRRKAAMLDKEDLENRLATLHREAQSKVEHDADVHQEADHQHRQELDRALRAAQTQIRDREAQITDYESKCSEMRRKLHQAKESAEKARSELDLEREQNVERSSVLRTELSAAEESLRRAHNDVQKARSAVASEVANTRAANEEVQALKVHVQDLEQSLRAKVHQISSLEQAVTSNKESANHAVLEIQRLANVQRSMTEKEQELRVELGETRTEVTLAKERVAALDLRYHQQGRELRESTEARSQSETEVTSLKVRSARAELEAQAAQARVSELEKDVAHQRSLAEQIAEKNSQHEQQLLAEADRRAASITADSNRKIDQVIAENTALQSTLTSAKYESARQDQELRSRIAETQNELKSAYNSVREREEQCASLRRRLESLEEEATAHNSASHAAALKETKLAAEVQSAQADASQVRRKLRDLEEQLACEQDHLRNLSNDSDLEISTLKDKLRRVQEEAEIAEENLRARLKEQSKEMESNLEKAVQQAQQEANRAQQLLNEKQKEASVQIHSLQDQLKKLDADHREADHLSKLRGKEIRSLTHELQNAHASNETFSKELEELTKQLAECQQSLQEAQTGLSGTSGALKGLVDVLGTHLRMPDEIQQALLSNQSAPVQHSVQQLLSLIQKQTEQWSQDNVIAPLAESLSQIMLQRSVSSRTSIASGVKTMVEQIEGLKSRLAEQEATVFQLTAEVQQTKEDARQMAILAREESVAPLKAELEQIKASVEASREAYTTDLARVEDAGRKKLRDAAQAAAAEVQSLQDSILELQAKLRKETAKNERVADELNRVRDQMQKTTAFTPSGDVKPTKGTRPGTPGAVGDLLRQIQDLDK